MNNSLILNNKKNLFINNIKEYLNSLNVYFIIIEDNDDYEINLSYIQKQKCIIYYKFKIDNINNIYVLFNHKDIRYNKLYDYYNNLYN